MWWMNLLMRQWFGSAAVVASTETKALEWWMLPPDRSAVSPSLAIMRRDHWPLWSEETNGPIRRAVSRQILCCIFFSATIAALAAASIANENGRFVRCVARTAEAELEPEFKSRLDQTDRIDLNLYLCRCCPTEGMKLQRGGPIEQLKADDDSRSRTAGRPTAGAWRCRERTQRLNTLV